MTEATKNKEKPSQNSELKKALLNICEPMCLKVSKEKPENIVEYMMKYLKNNYNYSSSLLNSDQNKELFQLKKDIQFFHEQEENLYYSEVYHKFAKNIKTTDKKNKSFQKQQQRLAPDEIIPSDDEDYNIPEEIDARLDDINFIKENANEELRPDYFEVNKDQNEKIEIKYNKKPDEIFEFLKINLIKSPLFSELSLDILTKCINAMTEVKYSEFSEVVRQGDYSENFYFILKGELECKMGFTIKKKEGNRTKIEKFDPRLVKVYYPGDYFCELNLLYYMPIRGSIKAVSDCILYTLDRKTYKYIINSSYNERSKNMIELFKKLPIFETLSDNEYEKLPDLSKEEIYYKGDTIIKENEYMNKLMIIEEGKCSGYKTVENGKSPKKIRDYNEEDFFGGIALLKEELSEESIIATSNIVKFICFDRRTIKNIFGSFEVILMRDPDVYEKYFPPIPEYSEQEPIKDNTKSLVLSFEGETINQNNNLNNKNIIDNKQSDNNIIDIGDNQNLQSRNTEKNNIQPEKINSLTYAMDEISKKSKEKEEMYESEIKRLKEEVSFLKNKLENRSYPELNYNNINKENDKNNFSNIDSQEKITKQINSENQINLEDINKKIMYKEIENNKIINNNNDYNNDINNNYNVNNNLNNIEINNNYNFNALSNKENTNENMENNNINLEQNLNIEETNYKLNNNLIDIQINNNEINKSNNEIKEQIKISESFEKNNNNDTEKNNYEINIERNSQNNLINNINESINEDKLRNNSNNFINNNEGEIINKMDSLNNSKMNEKMNSSQNELNRSNLRNFNKYKNLANLEIDELNNSKHKRTSTNRSNKNLEDFKIDSINLNKSKKIKSERGLDD